MKRGTREIERKADSHCTFQGDVTSYSRTRVACNERFRNFSGNRRTRLPARFTPTVYCSATRKRAAKNSTPRCLGYSSRSRGDEPVTRVVNSMSTTRYQTKGDLRMLLQWNIGGRFNVRWVDYWVEILTLILTLLCN